MVGPQEVLSFWLDEIGPKGWYEQSDALDEAVRTQFEPIWREACDGKFSLWLTYPTGALAYIILMDQLPRNMFRESEQAFSSDKIALAAAKSAISKRWDMRIDEPARQFFYLPMMHSENLCDQERCVRLICERMPEHGASNMLHARAHRDVIREFGRFPYRNEALGRVSTKPELEFLARGGYGEMIRSMQASKAA